MKKNAKKNVAKEMTIRKDGHLFKFFVLNNGHVEYTIDGGKTFAAKALKDGKVFFVKTQELIIKGEIVNIDNVELSEPDFVALKGALDAVLAEKNGKVSEEIKEGDLSQVDSWKCKRCTVHNSENRIRGLSGLFHFLKDRNATKQEYFLHTFRIGNDTYNFVERMLPNVGVVINPDYKISEECPEVGGIPKQYGELMFWDYYFEKDGWRRVRQLTGNELICLDIIRSRGHFASQREKTLAASHQ